MMEKRGFHAESSADYREKELFHVRRLIQLHLNMDLPLYPFCFEDQIRTGDAWYDSPGRSFLMLIAVEDGSVTYRIGGKKYTVVPGKLLVVPEFQAYYLKSEGLVHAYVLEIKGCHLSSILSSLHLNRTALYEMENFAEFLTSMKAIGNLADTENPSEFVSISGKSYELLVRLAFQENRKMEKSTLLPRILEFLEQDFERKVTMEELEKYTGLNKMTLIRMVKKKTGMTPMHYRLSRKIERAVYYLQIPGMQIKEIAYKLGFCNQNHLSKAFRSLMGYTPSGYRSFQKHLADQRDVVTSAERSAKSLPDPETPGAETPPSQTEA